MIEVKNLPLLSPKINRKKLQEDVFNSSLLMTEKQFKLFKYLRSKGIEALINWPKPLYKHKGLKLKNIKLKNNEQICQEILSLHIYPEMLPTEFSYITKTIHKFFK